MAKPKAEDEYGFKALPPTGSIGIIESMAETPDTGEQASDLRATAYKDLQSAVGGFAMQHEQGNGLSFRRGRKWWAGGIGGAGVLALANALPGTAFDLHMSLGGLVVLGAVVVFCGRR